MHDRHRIERCGAARDAPARVGAHAIIAPRTHRFIESRAREDGERAGRMSLVIEPGRTAKNYWHDLWRYRELMYFLAWRDLAVRYKQTAIGVAWALIRPA